MIKTILLATILFLIIVIGGFVGFFYFKSKTRDTDVPSKFIKIIVTIKDKLTNQNMPLKIKHVFVILEENHDWSAIYQNPDAPFINGTLLKQGAYASNYHNIPVSMGELHPSELNYIFLESGQVAFPDHSFSTDDDPSVDNSTNSIQHLVALLNKNGYTWKSYQEDISGNDCPITTNGDYAPKHNPFLFFQDVSGNPPSLTNKYCQQHIRPLSELLTDPKNNTVPNYIFITPNLQNDMHDGSITQADTWLAQIVPKITNSTIFKKDGALFITWDEGSEKKNKEDSKNNNPIGMIMLSPFIKPGYTNTTEYSHASLLKTIEEIFHLTPLLGASGNPQTKDLFDFFNLKP